MIIVCWRVWSAGAAGRPPGAQSGCAKLEVALLGQAGSHSRCLEVGVPSGGGIAGLFEQVGTHRFEAVGVRHPLVGVEGTEYGESGSGSVDVRQGDGAAQRDNWSRGDSGQDVVQREYLWPVGCFGGRGLVV